MTTLIPSTPAAVHTAGSVVVGVDRGARSRCALERALDEGRSLGRPVRVVHAWSPPLWMGDLTGLAHEPLFHGQDVADLARAVADEVLREGVISRHQAVTTEGCEGEPGHALVAAGAGAALLVLGGHGHGTVVGALLGSVTGRVLHHATCPVMVVPETASRVHAVDRVVVGTDGSPCSREALVWAAQAAERHDVPLLVLQAQRLTMRPGSSRLPVLQEQADEDLTWLRAEVEHVPGVAGLDVEVRVVHGGAAAVLLAEAGPSDLLVVGSRGRGGFAGLLLGSVSTQCAQHGRGAVVVVRS